jgi:Matrixin
MQRLVLPLLAALFLTAAAGTASAFCQTYTCEFDARQTCDVDPVTGCKSGGVKARWGSGCISYAVQSSGSLAQDISPEDLRDVLEEGFQAWTRADCAGARVAGAVRGSSPEFTATYRGEAACEDVEYNCGAADANANIVMFRDGNSDLSAYTIALSTIVANLRTGEILDVDIEINSQDFDFYLDDTDRRSDRQNLKLVLNHELGHMLGLSHSQEPGALMRAAYDATSPLPSADDVAGMCSVFAPALTDPVCTVSAIKGGGVCLGSDGACPVTVKADKSGCSLLPAPASGRAGPGAGLGLALLVARRVARGASSVRLGRRSGASRCPPA